MLPERILVLCPHPDDEVLMTGGLIRQAVNEKKEIFVAVVTNGDYLCTTHEKGERRLSESLRALGLLGLPEHRVFFLGYPDTGMPLEESFLGQLAIEKDPHKIFPASHGTKTYGLPSIKPDYHSLRHGQPAHFCRQDFMADLLALLVETSPQLVVTSSLWDRHGDHIGLCQMTQETLATLATPPPLWQSLVHSPAGDEAWPLPGQYQNPFEMPPQLEETTPLRWDERIGLTLPPEAVGAEGLKLRAINTYKTALNPEEPEVCAYLRAFARTDEIFWEVPPNTRY